MFEIQIDTKSRLLAKFVRELLAAETFESLTDLTEALKRLCGRRRVRWTNDDIGNAFRLIASNRELVARPRRVEPSVAARPDLQPAEASRIYREILNRYAVERVAAAAAAPTARTRVTGFESLSQIASRCREGGAA